MYSHTLLYVLFVDPSVLVWRDPQTWRQQNQSPSFSAQGTIIIIQGAIIITQGTIIITQGTIFITQGTIIITQDKAFYKDTSQ